MQNPCIFPAKSPAELKKPRQVELDPETLARAQEIIESLRQDPDKLRNWARKYDGLVENAVLVHDPNAMKRAFLSLPESSRALLSRVASRIKDFALAQRRSLTDIEIEVPGGRAGHRIFPHQSAGCYAPGGRFSLPSSVLMTVIPARVAGVSQVWVASPRPNAITLAAAHVAGADALLAVGGAQAIAALAYGVDPAPRCDIIVGPGNRYVTAAKQLVSGSTAIDMLAGPSELVIVADQSASPQIIAADLLAQAEHDPDAWPVLIAQDATLVQKVSQSLSQQLSDLSTAKIAQQALLRGGYTIVDSRKKALELCDELAAEHVELLLEDPESAAGQLRCYGGLFIGSPSAEVFGDYGVGPNHVLPTSGTGRHRGGLSVFDFVAVRSWLAMDEQSPGYSEVLRDSAKLARMEGLEAHARSAEQRRRASF